jgi:Fur family ferric uptake transcriptional regulator
MVRSTRQKTAIRSVLEVARRPLSPQEILEEARRQVPELGIATVYRNLKGLQERDEIRAVELPGESPRYELASVASVHHHHFQCTVCGRVFDLHACRLDLASMIPAGFTLERHEITLYGRCAEHRSGAAVKPPT